MKNLTRAFTWFMVVATCMVCLIGTVLVMRDRFLFDILNAFFFRPLIERFVLQVAIFGVIASGLTISYIIVVHRSANKEWVRLVYAGIGLLVALAFVFSEYQHQQEKLVIRDVCTQFDLAVARNDYETAFEFMLPDFQQTHSLAQFIDGEGRRFNCEYSHKSIRVLLFHPKAREASVIHIPLGSLNTEIFLEQVDDKWYFTGEARYFSG